MREIAGVSFGELMEFTGWERSQWRERLSAHGDAALGTGVGAHGDGRFETVGDLVKHIFIAEKHHVDRLSNRPITDVSTIPGDTVEKLFAFGERSRRDLAAFVAAEPADDWDASREYEINGKIVTVTPRKFIASYLASRSSPLGTDSYDSAAQRHHRKFSRFSIQPGNGRNHQALNARNDS
jgi:uncharacterized damage-inducible protein DinB